MFTRPGNSNYNPSPAVVGDTPTVDPGITSLAQLLMVSTINLLPPFIKIYVDYTTGKQQTYTLIADSYGNLPNDYNATTNAKSWHKAAT